MSDWLKQNIWWLTIASLVLFVAGIVAVVVYVVRMPADQFVQSTPMKSGGHSAGRWFRLALSNVTGVILIVLGGVMSLPLVPGPGLILILVGLSMTDFPGKRALELWLIRKRIILSPINWLRRKFDRPPLELPK